MNTDHSIKNTRFGLRATHEQAVLLRFAAEVTHKSLTDFILDSACVAAEQALLDKRLFVVNEATGQQFLDLLNRAETDNQGLKKLFSQPAPWESQ